MFRFNIRDLCLLTFVVALALGWFRQSRYQYAMEREFNEERRGLLWQMHKSAQPSATPIPMFAPAWQIYGPISDQFVIEIDEEFHHSGTASASIKSIVALPNSSGMIAQAIKADDYRGKRVRLSGYVKTQDVTTVAWLFLRAEGPMNYGIDKSPRIIGTTEWTKHEIVLDIPNSAADIAFGAGLQGAGQIWVDDFQFEIVSPNVPLSARAYYVGPKQPFSMAVQAEPHNLDVEK